MCKNELIKKLRGGAKAAYDEDIVLYLKQEDCADAADEIVELRHALAGLYVLCKMICLGNETPDEIRHHLATNHRSIDAARLLGFKSIELRGD